MAGADDPGSVPFDPYKVPVRLAATLMLVRDGVSGLEVAMLRRSLTASFVGGAHVFPGGAVDPQDASAAMAARCRGLDVASANEVLRVPQDGFAYWVAAVRESFEEAGLLVAEHDDGTPVDLRGGDVASRFVAHRADVHVREHGHQGQKHDGDQRAGNGRGHARQQVDDGQPGGDHCVHGGASPDELRELRGEDQ